ncbi:hypothetical protein PTSG_09023 [Salpingoeca rosetta]|uniref:Phytanoyl-CoA dioxygenase n=1 Tax=Salpingoeca rosetta (strain ATCC 50818 / BSB-021) TaxID=946362 RepID=F2ULZ8_SALR5|nr:uncharacterized protein PTSG_09023 [Salpingoeca rosetta]EGD78147.1 hypothetical protein PTSG_09023 [Salpingoeca rosetta]|eukprot:XP_004989823.1 hypothetical protein PTSG_09023 [Salpingoeca rosetta]
MMNAANKACGCFCFTLVFHNGTDDATNAAMDAAIPQLKVDAELATAALDHDGDIEWLDWKIGQLDRNKRMVCVYGSLKFEQESVAGHELETALEEALAATPARLPDLRLQEVEVEMVATLPVRVPLESVCINDITHTAAASNVSDLQSQISRLGIAVLKDALSTAVLQQAKEEADKAIERADKALKARGIDIGHEDFRFKEISSRQKQRFDLLLDMDECVGVNALGTLGPWRQLVEAILGKDVVFQTSVVYSRPGAEEQTWHADGPHVGRTADWTGCGHEAPYALCVFVPLVQFSPELGFTQFWPGSHKYDGLLGFGPVCPLIECAVDGLVDLGAALVYDYRLIHRGMPNTSESSERPMLQFLYHRPTYKEARNYGTQSLFAAA